MVSGIFGLPGSGKSLFLGYLAHRAALGKNINSRSLVFQTQNKYDKVYTNFPCPGCYSFKYDELGEKDFSQCLIVIDEIMLLSDSRDFKSFSSSLKFFYSQHRKFNLDLIYASQCYDDVDKKIRGITERLYYVSRSTWFDLFNFSLIRRIDSFFDVAFGKISEGYQYAPPSCNYYFYRPKAYDFIDSFSTINKSVKEDVAPTSILWTNDNFKELLKQE